MSASDAKCKLSEFPRMLQCALQRYGPVMKKPLAADVTEDCASCPVPYVQLQNNSLPVEFEFLQGDITNSVSSFGTAVFGVPPEACNMWLGSSLSVLSMHQDWYENLYGVVRGTKLFTLVAPWEAPRLAKVRARSASYVHERTVASEWKLSPFFALDDANSDGAADGSTNDNEGPPAGFADWIDVDLDDTPAEEGQPLCGAPPLKLGRAMCCTSQRCGTTAWRRRRALVTGSWRRLTTGLT